MKWYDDASLVAALPLRYRAYAMYSHFIGKRNSRGVTGGSFLLRMLREASSLAGKATVAPVHGIDGLTVMADFADERVLEVIHEIRGEDPEYAVMRELIGKGDTFVDVGANFGTFSLLASRLVGESGNVIAIEPQPRLVSLIEQSVALSHAGNCHVVPRACGRAEGTQKLLVPVHDSGRAGFFSSFSGAKPHEEMDASVTTLDSVFASLEPQRNVFVKIDVEGSEMDVLDGGVESLTSMHPTIMIEINPWSAKAAGQSATILVGRLRDLGYRSFASARDFPRIIDPAEIPSDMQLNLIARA